MAALLNAGVRALRCLCATLIGKKARRKEVENSPLMTLPFSPQQSSSKLHPYSKHQCAHFKKRQGTHQILNKNPRKLRLDIPKRLPRIKMRIRPRIANHHPLGAKPAGDDVRRPIFLRPPFVHQPWVRGLVDVAVEAEEEGGVAWSGEGCRSDAGL